MAANQSTQIFTTTTVFKTEKVADGKWKISEIKSDPPPQQDLHSGNRKDLQFDLALGIGIGGYYDFDDKEISISATFGGSPIGTRYTAGLTNGVAIGIDIWAAKGSIRVYGENSQLKLQYTLGGFWMDDKSDNFVICDV